MNAYCLFFITNHIPAHHSHARTRTQTQHNVYAKFHVLVFESSSSSHSVYVISPPPLFFYFHCVIPISILQNFERKVLFFGPPHLAIPPLDSGLNRFFQLHASIECWIMHCRNGFPLFWRRMPDLDPSGCHSRFWKLQYLQFFDEMHSECSLFGVVTHILYNNIFLLNRFPSYGLKGYLS